MNVYAIGDLHLSFENRVVPGEWEQVKEYKPMGVFGETWEKHYQKIYENWCNTIKPEDLVLIPGDISWARTLEEAEYDFDFIDELPGKKVFIKGNHDYWWQGITKMRNILPESIYLIQNDFIELPGIIIAGSRGWVVPNSHEFTEHDKKIFQRELLRLELSLNKIEKTGGVLIVMLHYMPVNEKHEKNQLIELLIEKKVDICIYGHLHDEAHQIRLDGVKWGMRFKLVSADFLQFKPLKILEV